MFYAQNLNTANSRLLQYSALQSVHVLDRSISKFLRSTELVPAFRKEFYAAKRFQVIEGVIVGTAPMILRPSGTVHGQLRWAVASRLRGEAGNRDHQHLERHQPLSQPSSTTRGGCQKRACGRPADFRWRCLRSHARRNFSEADHDDVSQPVAYGDRGIVALLSRDGCVLMGVATRRHRRF